MMHEKKHELSQSIHVMFVYETTMEKKSSRWLEMGCETINEQKCTIKDKSV